MVDWHVVVLKRKSFSVTTRRGTFPVPEMGSKCVCCDAETKDTAGFNPTAGPYASSGIRIPRCAACEDHVAKSNPVALVVVALIGILTVVVGATNWLPVAIAGVAMLFGVGIAFLRLQDKRAKMARDGHHTGLEIAAIPDLVSIRTTNKRLADDVRALNADLVG